MVTRVSSSRPAKHDGTKPVMLLFLHMAGEGGLKKKKKPPAPSGNPSFFFTWEDRRPIHGDHPLLREPFSNKTSRVKAPRKARISVFLKRRHGLNRSRVLEAFEGNAAMGWPFGGDRGQHHPYWSAAAVNCNRAMQAHNWPGPRNANGALEQAEITTCQTRNQRLSQTNE